MWTFYGGADGSFHSVSQSSYRRKRRAFGWKLCRNLQEGNFSDRAFPDREGGGLAKCPQQEALPKDWPYLLGGSLSVPVMIAALSGNGKFRGADASASLQCCYGENAVLLDLFRTNVASDERSLVWGFLHDWSIIWPAWGHFLGFAIHAI